MTNKILAIIPSYKPDNNLIDLVKKLSKEEIDIVIVDDGSGAEYKNILNKCKDYAKIISYEENKGKGYALKTGLKYIKENYKEPYFIVTMDCDGQHTINDAKKVINELFLNDEALIVGKRVRKGKIPVRSRIGNAITRFIYRSATRIDVYDTQSGLRAFSSKLIDYLLKIEGNRFEYEMNVLLKCAKDRIKIKETEITTIYIDNNSSSHFNAIKDSYRIYKEIIKFTLNRKRK